MATSSLEVRLLPVRNRTLLTMCVLHARPRYASVACDTFREHGPGSRDSLWGQILPTRVRLSACSVPECSEVWDYFLRAGKSTDRCFDPGRREMREFFS